MNLFLDFIDLVSPYWYTVNLILGCVAIWLTYRNMREFQWNWQEKRVVQGVALILLGGILGRIDRLFDVVRVTIGAPFASFGLLLYIYGTIGKPIRFEHQNHPDITKESP